MMRPSAPPLLTDAVAPVARPGPLAGALGYAALVFALWSVYVAALYPAMSRLPDSGGTGQRLLGETARALIFVLPVFLYLRLVAASHHRCDI